MTRGTPKTGWTETGKMAEPGKAEAQPVMRQSRSLSLWVPGEPVPKERPRVVQRVQGSRTYTQAFTPGRTRTAETRIGWLAVEALEGIETPDADHEWAVFLRFYCQRRRPDVDNLTKLVLDALNRVVWTDDRQVSYVRARRLMVPAPLVGTRIRACPQNRQEIERVLTEPV